MSANYHIPIQLPLSPYTVRIAPLPQLCLEQKVAIITNDTIKTLHLPYLLEHIEAKELHLVSIADGEQYKNIDSVMAILDELFTHKLDRGSLVIAFGGGVIGDISGFVAALYQRGIGYIQIPTTLLSQVDSSVGGKTGVNNRFGKNLIGAFHQPQAVYIDPFFLTTLPQREIQAGLAEIIKMAVGFDEDFFTWLQGQDLYDIEKLPYAIKRTVELKAMIVIADEREQNIRAKLNYGHTFAHIIENQTHYNTYLHGEGCRYGYLYGLIHWLWRWDLLIRV